MFRRFEAAGEGNNHKEKEAGTENWSQGRGKPKRSQVDWPLEKAKKRHGHILTTHSHAAQLEPGNKTANNAQDVAEVQTLWYRRLSSH